MKEEYMTPQERMTAAINLEKPDRVPINPLIGMNLAATYYGLNTVEMNKYPIKGLDIILKFFDEFGGWDGYRNAVVRFKSWPRGIRASGECSELLQGEIWKNGHALLRSSCDIA